MRFTGLSIFSKAQSAIEYLMTYGWMLLVVAIVGGAVFSVVGDQSIENISGFESNEIQVGDFGMTGSSLQMSLETFGANNIELQEVEIRNPDTQSITIPLNDEISVGSSHILNLPHLTQSSETNDIEVELTYDKGGLEDITTTGTITGQIELDNSLVGYWTLNEKQANTTHIYDISQNNNEGEIQNAEFNEAEGMEFNGENSKVTLGNAPEFDQTNGFTASIWFRPESFDYIVGIFNRYGGSSTGGWYISLGTNEPYRSLRTVVITEPAEDNYDSAQTSSELLEASKWYHGVARFDKDSVDLFINGELESSAPADGELANVSDADTELGHQGGDYFNGDLKEVMFFNRALTDQQIQSLYDNPRIMQ